MEKTAYASRMSRVDGALQRRYERVKASFIEQETSLHAWCVQNRIAMPNARAALLGVNAGPKSQALANQILQECGLARATK